MHFCLNEQQLQLTGYLRMIYNKVLACYISVWMSSSFGSQGIAFYRNQSLSRQGFEGYKTKQRRKLRGFGAGSKAHGLFLCGLFWVMYFGWYFSAVQGTFCMGISWHSVSAALHVLNWKRHYNKFVNWESIHVFISQRQNLRTSGYLWWQRGKERIKTVLIIKYTYFSTVRKSYSIYM